MAQGSGGNSSKYGGFGGGSFDPRETSPKEKKKDEGTLSRSKWDAEDDGFGMWRAILAQFCAIILTPHLLPLLQAPPSPL